MTGIESYDNKTKDNVRRWQMNQVAEFVRGNGTRKTMKSATMLYLCGPEDFDRPLAIERGFRNENVIAVDLSGGNVANIRKDGRLAIKCNLIDLLLQWPEDWPIKAIVADLCCGLDNTAMALAAALFRSKAVRAAKYCAFAINLQRGRDQSSNNVRRMVNAYVDRCADSMKSKVQIVGGPDFDCLQNDSLNRAKILYEYMLVMWASMLNDKMQTDNEIVSSLVLARSANPARFYSYRSKPSNRITMDSMVMSFVPIPECPIQRPRMNACLDQFMADYGFKASDIKPKISALRAVRTMRASGYYTNA